MHKLIPGGSRVRDYLVVAHLRKLSQQSGFPLVLLRNEMMPLWAASISRSETSEGRNLELQISSHLVLSSRTAQRLLRCLNYWLPKTATYLQSSQQNTRFNFCSDDAGDESMLSMDSPNERWLVPDEYSVQDYLKKKPNQNIQTQKDFEQGWLQREPILFWRGNTTGGAIHTLSDLESLPRVRLCKAFSDKTLFNLKISKTSKASSLPAKDITNWLRRNDLFGPKVRESHFGNYRYYPDIPGNALAWGTLRKYRLGCLVFKPETNRSLSYYKLIHPWEHYIPISHDFSDLREKLKWANNNEQESAQIAYQGYSFANNYIANLDKYFYGTLQQYEDDLSS